MLVKETKFWSLRLFPGTNSNGFRLIMKALISTLILVGFEERVSWIFPFKIVLRIPFGWTLALTTPRDQSPRVNSVRGLPQELVPALVSPSLSMLTRFCVMVRVFFPICTCNDYTIHTSLAFQCVEPLPSFFKNSLRDCTSTNQSKTYPRWRFSIDHLLEIIGELKRKQLQEDGKSVRDHTACRTVIFATTRGWHLPFKVCSSPKCYMSCRNVFLKY